MYGEAVIISLAQIQVACTCSLFNCISIMDGTETNEQNKSIATGLIYMYAHSKFDAFSTLYVEKCEIVTCWISDLCTDGM